MRVVGEVSRVYQQFGIPHTYKRTADASGRVVTCDEIKQHLRLTVDDFDTELERLESAAVDVLEEDVRRQFLTATWTLTLDRFPEVIEIERCPLISVTSIAYIDSAGDSQTLSASNYRVDTTSEPGRITPAFGLSWPTTRNLTGAVTVTFTAGYGAARSSVPASIRQAVLLWVEGEYLDCDMHETIQRLMNRVRYSDGLPG